MQSTWREWFSYWSLAWKDRPKGKTFTLLKAVPSIIIATIQYFLRQRSSRSVTDVWIAIIIVIAVYLALSMLEGIRNFVFLSPVNLHIKQNAKISQIETTLAGLRDSEAVSPQEQRKRDRVRQMLTKFDEQGVVLLRYVLDQGEVSARPLMSAGLGRESYQNLTRGKNCNLIHEYKTDKTVYSINPELKAALAFVLSEKAG